MRTFAPKQSLAPESKETSLRFTKPQKPETENSVKLPGKSFEPVVPSRFVHNFAGVPVRIPAIQKKSLEISNPADADEKEADDVARKIVDGQPAKIRETGASLNRSGAGSAEATPEFRATLESSKGSGHTLDDSTRTKMEAKMDADLSGVRIHTGAAAHKMNEDVNAKAFTYGQDIFFSQGAFNTNSRQGNELLAHELVHTVQQASHRVQPKLQRAPNNKDPLCDTFDFNAVKFLVETKVKSIGDGSDTELRHSLIRTLKLIRRCATEEQQSEVKGLLSGISDAKQAEAIWNEAGTIFGGYTGMFPEYATDIKTRLTKLGVSSTVPFSSFSIKDYPTGPGSKSDAKKAAKGEFADVARTDILYFRGHQFAQYRSPGVFTDGAITRAVDLRYIEQTGGYPNVKLMISTSCATLCDEALNLFHGLFPNAVLLGFGKSAPEDGAKMRISFETGLKDLKRPLLLDEAVDISSIISSWKSTVEVQFKGNSATKPGYFDGTLHYWDGKSWHDVDPKVEDNKCKVKGDRSSVFPAP